VAPVNYVSCSLCSLNGRTPRRIVAARADFQPAFLR
jgi:hypothetical protein